MGQYFVLVNLDKKEYVCPYEIEGTAKLWEWCANVQAGVIPFLLRQSSEGGGGDIHKEYAFAGRWAGDRVAMVGDYDESGLYDKARLEFAEIGHQMLGEIKDFMGSVWPSNKKDEPGVRVLPRVMVGRKMYFVDARLGELRNVKNPHDRVEFVGRS